MNILIMLSSLGAAFAQAEAPIDRRKIVENCNVRRNASSDSTPLQVGNGNFAFGADITGLQTFSPFATMSTWGWHNFSLPTTPNQTSIGGMSAYFQPLNLRLHQILALTGIPDFTGLDWWTHGRLVNYDRPNPAEADISNWLIQNPQRLNLGNIGIYFGDSTVVEGDLSEKSQVLDLWSGTLISTFSYNGSQVKVETRAAADSDTVGIQIDSELLSSGGFGLFFDFPYSDLNKFDAPYVGVWNATGNHSTSLEVSANQLVIEHVLDNNSYFLTGKWDGSAQVSGPKNGTHRYFLTAPGATRLNLTASFSPTASVDVPSLESIKEQSESWWESYWTSGAFIDLSSTDSENATELQRRIIQSQYLMAVNSASSYPPQESGLVNNGWYGKFHVCAPFPSASSPLGSRAELLTQDLAGDGLLASDSLCPVEPLRSAV